MTGTYAPKPIRLLLALTDPTQTKLRRALFPLRPEVDLTCIRPNDVRAYLNEPNYYHVLHVSPMTWRGFVPAVRQNLASKVSLVFGLPEKASPADFSEPRASLYFTDEVKEERVIELCVQLYSLLNEKKTLQECVRHLGEGLAFLGTENCWTIEENTLSRKTRTVEPETPMQEGNNAININVSGDQVNGGKTIVHATGDQVVNVRAEGTSKIVQQAGGDQVNTNRLAGANVEITQKAQGDQANVNRTTNSVPDLEQSAGGSQANVNTVTQSPVLKLCSNCAKELPADAKFCSNCGTRL